MAQLPEFRRLLREDVKEAPSWIERLLVPLNVFMEQTYQAFNKNLTIGDNIVGKWQEGTFVTPATYTAGDFNIFEVPWDQRKNVQGVFVAQIREDADTYITVVNAVSCDWLQLTTAAVKINYIAGLENSKKYDYRLLLL